jgi:hypothetical protein
MPSAKYNRAWLLLFFFLAIPGIAIPQQESLPAAEFARLVQTLSEEGGYFFSDNFTSNEDSYLTIVDKMKELGATGGAYIGVGPEQNFTYIAKVRPKIAFIVDIRRQAMIQHLMYKAIFHLSPTRADFISRLLSRPMTAKAPGQGDSIDSIVAYISAIPADNQTYAQNLAAIRRTIQQDCKFPLSVEDQESLDYVYRNFRNQGFEIGFDINGMWSRRFGHLPTLREIILQKDLKGKQGNFLASVEDYDFVRDMQRRNMIIPVVGDFGGKKALASVGDYLRKKGYVVSVFYASNVEIVLFDYGMSSPFPGFVENIKKLPTNDRSILIRSTFYYYGHPLQQPGYSLCTMLQKISVFLSDYSEGRYRNYRDLIRTHYIQ